MTCRCIVDVSNCLFTSFIAISTVYSRTFYLGEFGDSGAVKTDGRGGGHQYRKTLRDAGSILPLSFNVCVRACVQCVFSPACVRGVCVNSVLGCLCLATAHACTCVCGLYVRAVYVCIRTCCVRGVWAAGCLANAHWPTCQINLSNRPAIIAVRYLYIILYNII